MFPIKVLHETRKAAANMAMITMLMMAAGVLISTIGGLVHQAGSNSLYGSLDWLPQSELLFANPGTAFVMGLGLLLAGIVCQPRRVS